MCRFRIAALAVTGLLFTAAQPVAAEIIYGIDGSNSIISFDSATPGTLLASRTVTGLVNGDSLYDLNFRPSNGVFYSLGVPQASGTSAGIHFYTINPTNGVASLVSTTGPLPGIGPTDFDPVADRLRMAAHTFTDTLNLSINVDTGQITSEGTLSYASGDPRRGLNSAVTGIAYTNSYAGAASTTLYAIEGGAQGLVTIAPPETGTLHTVGANGVPTPSGLGFDISGLSGTAYLVFETGRGQLLNTVNLQTGAVTPVDTIADRQHIYGITVPVTAAVPEPRSFVLICTGLLGVGVAAWRRTCVSR